MGIIDIVLIVIALIAVIVGLVKGGAGVLLGFLGTIVIAVGLGVGLSVLAPKLIYADSEVGLVADSEQNFGYTSIFSSLYNPISSPFVSMDNDFMNAVFTEEAGMVSGPFGEEGEVAEVSVGEAMLKAIPLLSSVSFLGGVTSFVGGVIAKHAVAGLTVGEAVAGLITYIAFCAIIWLISFIVLVIVKRIIRHFVFKALDSHSVASKVDRAIGAVLSVALVVVIFWGIFSFIDVNKGTWGIEESVNNFSAQSKAFGIMQQNNLINMLSGKGNVGADTAVDEAGELCAQYPYSEAFFASFKTDFLIK